MPRTWEELLQDGTLGGVAFKFIEVSDEFGKDLDERAFYGRDGAEIEVRGSKARRWHITAVIPPEDYPEVRDALKEVCERNELHEFVHPVDGSFPKVAVESGKWGHSVLSGVDCASLDLTLIEHTEGAPFADTTTLGARANAAREAAAQVVAAAVALDAVIDPYDGQLLDPYANQRAGSATAQGAASSGVEAADSLEAESATLSISDVEQQVNGVRTEISQALEQLGDYTLPEQYELARALTTLADALATLGRAVIEQLPPVTTVRIETDVPLLVWLHERYQGTVTVEQILALNPQIEDPLMLTVGLELRAYGV